MMSPSSMRSPGPRGPRGCASENSVATQAGLAPRRSHRRTRRAECFPSHPSTPMARERFPPSGGQRRSSVATCPRSTHRFAPITSAACCDRPRCTRRGHSAPPGRSTPTQLREVEDAAIAEAVRRVEALGMRSVTDGEFRRGWFHLDFLAAARRRRRHRQHRLQLGLGNDRAHDAAEAVGRGAAAPRRDIQVDDFRYLASVTTETPKVCIPSPTMVHFRGGRAAIDIDAYPDLDVFFADLPRATAPSSRPSTPPDAAMSSSTTPTSPTCATRRCVPAPSTAATIPTPCRTPTPS